MERWGLSYYNEFESREYLLVIKFNELEVDVYFFIFIDKYFIIWG